MTKLSFAAGLLAAGLGLGACATPPAAPPPSLWEAYTHYLQGAKYVDLTHTLTPHIPVPAVFGRPHFCPHH